MACKKGHNADHPTWDYVVADWMKMDLTALGTVDKVVFYLDSSDKDEMVKCVHLLGSVLMVFNLQSNATNNINK